MKIKNISVGDSVQLKKRLVSNIFRKKQVCEVIKIDSEHEFRPDVLVKGEYCLGWVNHKDLKKPIQREPEPKLKVLDQSIFNDLDAKWRFAMVSSMGIPFVYDYKPTGKRVFFSDDSTQQKISAGKVMRIDEYDYDTSDWQDSLIKRDKVDLTGSDLVRAMLERGDKAVMCFLSNANEADALERRNIGVVISHGKPSDFNFENAFNSDGWWFAVPINNQGEPLTASEVGL